MKLSKIEITNFRCFESLTVPLQPDVNVFVGVNGSGKTAILDAIALAFGDDFQHGPSAENSKTMLMPFDIRLETGPGNTVTQCKNSQVSISANNIFPVRGLQEEDNRIIADTLRWTKNVETVPNLRSLFSANGPDSPLRKYFRALHAAVLQPESGNSIPVPVIAYYRSTRSLSRAPDFVDMRPSTLYDLLLDRWNAHSQALDASADYRSMFQWYYLRENQELREKVQIRNDNSFEFPDLRAIRGALRGAMENVERMLFLGNLPRPVIIFSESRGTPKALDLEQLSGGYRNLLAVVLDFARRLAQANPDFENPLEAPGILLIDEIELHLHPKWQQRVIPDLRKVFPNTQLIVTTHSPQVLTTVHPQNIAILKDEKLYAPYSRTFGAESKEVMQHVMETESRPPDNDYADGIRKLFTLINNNDLDSAAELHHELSSKMGADDPALIEAEMTIKNRLWEQEIGL
jgi:predicted ATP-binding protein involved in virulence